MKEHTDPLSLQVIVNFWFGEEYIIDSDSEQEYGRVYNTMKEIGVSQMWCGFIPRNMIVIQDSYFQSIGSPKSGKEWGKNVYKLQSDPFGMDGTE